MKQELLEKHEKERQEALEAAKNDHQEEEEEEEEELVGIPTEIIYPPTSQEPHETEGSGNQTQNEGHIRSEHSTNEATGDGGGVGGGGKKKTRAQKRKEKKEKEREQIKKLAEQVGRGPDMRSCELATLHAALEDLNLYISSVAADGNCLFRAVADQLQQLHLEDKIVDLRPRAENSPLLKTRDKNTALHDHAVLRVAASDFILNNRDMFEPFLMLEDSADGDGVDFEDYCAKIADISGKKWGGQPEIVALTKVLNCPIEIWKALQGSIDKVASGCREEGFNQILQRAYKVGIACNDTAKDCFGENEPGPPLRVSFHTYYYATGDHYNSVRPKTTET